MSVGSPPAARPSRGGGSASGGAAASRAGRWIGSFERRFGKAHLDFACHAAVPIALTPELSYQLWSAFRVDVKGASIGAPWIAVADLLLSELCSEIGSELYEIRPEARKALVARLRDDPRFGEARLREVARFLLAAAESGLRTRDPQAASLATSQRWAALAYTEPERAAAMIAEAMGELSAVDPMAWARMEALLADLDEPLAGHAPLRSLASAMAALGRGEAEALKEHVSQHGERLTVAGRDLAVPSEALSVIAAPRSVEVSQQREASQGAMGGAEELPAAALNVLVVGTGTEPVPAEVREAANALGEALAKAGHNLFTGAWYGVDESAARAFVGAVGSAEAAKKRLVQFTEAGLKPPFPDGKVVHVDTADMDDIIGYHNAAVRPSDVVVGIGGRGGTGEILRAADTSGKHVVPLRWTGGDAGAFEPSTSGPEPRPLHRTARVRRMLEPWGLPDLQVSRLTARAMAVIELANPNMESLFRDYTGAVLVLLHAIGLKSGFPSLGSLNELRAELADAAAREAFRGLDVETAAARVERCAAPFPEWVLFDLARVSEIDGWSGRTAARQALLRVAGVHCRPQIADLASTIWSGSTPHGMTDELRDLILAVRSSIGDAAGFLHWGQLVVRHWVPVLLTGTAEMSDRGHLMVEALRSLAPPHSAGESAPLLGPLLTSASRADRMVGYLWTCAFAGEPAGEDPFGVALEREMADADEWGTPWALLWLARALIAVLDALEAPDPSIRRTAHAHVEATLKMLYQLWKDHPETEPHGAGLALLHDRLIFTDRAHATEEARQESAPAERDGGTAPASAAVMAREPERQSWAVQQSEDEFGTFAIFAVGSVVQRMRWIPPGRFGMGSPEGEAGRFSDEGPQHEVTLRSGLWLADTPCTQALWQAVMGHNPSRFRSAERAVERVSFDDCQAFLKRLSGMVPGLVARLPSEAEWEYACRGGTTAATWAGDLEIRGERNAPLLDKIAWYGGNSGAGFELSGLNGGEDSSAWSEKQYSHTLAGTRPVRGKKPNPFGLYDMLGDVYEWCADLYGPYPADGAAVIDPPGPLQGSRRVLRGGAWNSRARHIRAANRDALSPEIAHDHHVGFRIAAGPGPRRS